MFFTIIVILNLIEKALNYSVRCMYIDWNLRSFTANPFRNGILV